MMMYGKIQVTYIQGYCREEKKEESETNWQETSLEDGGGKTAYQEADAVLKENREYAESVL